MVSLPHLAPWPGLGRRTILGLWRGLWRRPRLDVDDVICLTFDQDWAPAWATREVHRAVVASGLSATFFATQACEALADLRREGAFELAWHPNFLPGSTHGGDVDAVLETMREIVPEGRGVRAHALVRSTPLLIRYGQLGLRYEASDLMDGQTGLEPRPSWNGVIRLPIYWEDDVHLLFGRPCGGRHVEDLLGLSAPGLKCLNFHPVLIALNADDLAGYEGLKAALAERGARLDEASPEDVARFRQRERPGIGDLFAGLVAWLARRPDRVGGRLIDVAMGVPGAIGVEEAAAPWVDGSGQSGGGGRERLG